MAIKLDPVKVAKRKKRRIEDAKHTASERAADKLIKRNALRAKRRFR